MTGAHATSRRAAPRIDSYEELTDAEVALRFVEAGLALGESLVDCASRRSSSQGAPRLRDEIAPGQRVARRRREVEARMCRFVVSRCRSTMSWPTSRG